MIGSPNYAAKAWVYEQYDAQVGADTVIAPGMGAGVVLLNIAPQIGQGSQATAKAQIEVLSTALNSYRLANGFYPTQAQGLEALVNQPTQAPVPQNYPDGGYLNSRTLPLDPWKRPYIYLIPGRQNEPFEVISYGADGEPGGSGANADISSANPN